MAQNLEHLEKLISQGGSIFHSGHIARKIFFLKHFFFLLKKLGGGWIRKLKYREEVGLKKA